MGRFYWRPSWSETLRSPVVVKRTPIQIICFMEAVLSDNMSLLNKSIQSIFEQRKEAMQKILFERKSIYDHFPCQKLNVIGVYSYGG